MTDILAIDLRAVSKIFGPADLAFVAVENVSLAIRNNEFFTLLGPSGCGKTTLLRLIAGFEFPTKGEIFLADENVGAMPPFKRPINMVFQNYALFPHLSVAENIGFGLKMLGKPQSEIAARVNEMLKLVRMEELSKRQISQISGGQQQRVALARALAPRPQVLLLDEPLSALDFKLRKEMQIELKRLQSETGITFIFVTHDQEEALTMSDRIAVMSHGRVLQVGSPREIYDAPANRFVADFIGESNFLQGRIITATDSRAEVALLGGGNLTALASGGRKDQKVTIVLRPEHAKIVKANVGQINGKITDIVYFGTDTHFQIALGHGENFTLRQQNKPGFQDGHKIGEDIGILIEPGAARVIAD